ncbi:t-SNARE [Entophlyctis helioformis]|nr:t-SNARE [Entophlyctis helioformis]
MTSIFETYEREYRTLADAIAKKLGGQLSDATGEQRKLLLNQVQREFEEADEIIGQMEMELVSLPPPQRNAVGPRVNQYKEELKKLKKDTQKKTTAGAYTSERDQLLGGRGGNASTTIDLEAASMDQRSRLLQGTERLQNSSRRLEEARRVALETEQIGISTLADLSAQREQIVRTQNRLGTADSWIAKSQGVLRSMQRRLQENKLLSAGIIALLIFLILAIIASKFM